MLVRVRLTLQARSDLLELWRYIAQRDPAAADRVLDRIAARCEQLAGRPRLGRARPDIRPDARSLTVERWLVLYRVIDGGVQIVRVVDGARDLRRVDWPRK